MFSRLNQSNQRSGLSLLELVVVLVVLVAVAGIVTPMVTQNLADSAETITKHNLRVVQEAVNQYMNDVGDIPTDINDLFSQPAGVSDFDPAYRTGWNGPYLVDIGTRTVVGGNEVTAVLDGWTNPLLIQVPEFEGDASTISTLEREYVRLISTGPDGILQTSTDQNATTRGDDLVLFLRVTDPQP